MTKSREKQLWKEMHDDCRYSKQQKSHREKPTYRYKEMQKFLLLVGRKKL